MPCCRPPGSCRSSSTASCSTIFGTKATAVFTNVPGPKQTLYFAGQALTDLYFWVPQAGHLGLGVSILSYDGGVRMGVGTDAGLIPDPERIIDGFHAEFAALQQRRLPRLEQRRVVSQSSG